MNLKLPSSSARARTVIVAGTFLGALVTGGWLLQRGARTGTFTAYEGAHLFENVFRRVQNDYVDAAGVSPGPDDDSPERRQARRHNRRRRRIRRSQGLQ